VDHGLGEAPDELAPNHAARPGERVGIAARRASAAGRLYDPGDAPAVEPRRAAATGTEEEGEAALDEHLVERPAGLRAKSEIDDVLHVAIFRIDPRLDPFSVRRAFLGLKLDFSGAPILPAISRIHG
jgi:hypothetical protein